MPRKPPAPSPGTVDDVEAEFYDALQRGDLERLMAIWSDDDEACCVHPGGPRLVGAAAIRGSFAALFARGPVPVEAEQVRRVETLSTAMHSVLERVPVTGESGPGEAFFVATNVYVKGPRGWRLVAHHASPATASELVGTDVPPSQLH